MATLFEQQEKDKEEEQQQADSQPLTTGAGAASGGISPVGGAQPTAQQRKGSGRFTNLQKYIQANQGAGQRLGERITRGAETQATRAEKEATSRMGDIRSTISDEFNRFGKAKDYASQIGQMGGAQELIGDKEKMAEFTRLRDAKTALPDLKTSSQDILGQYGQSVENLGKVAEKAGTERGRFDLLRQTIGGPRYTSGQGRLDQLFLQSSGQGTLRGLQQGLQQRAQTQKQARDKLQGEIDTGLGDIQTKAADAQKTLTGALGGFEEEGGGALGDLYSQLEKARQEAEASQTQQIQELQRGLSTGALSDEQLELLGINPEMKTYGLRLKDFSQYIKPGDVAIQRADVISPEQQQRLEALATLSGIDPTSIQLGQAQGEAGARFTEAGQQELQRALRQRRDEYFDRIRGIEDKFLTTVAPRLVESRYGGIPKDLNKILNLFGGKDANERERRQKALKTFGIESGQIQSEQDLENLRQAVLKAGEKSKWENRDKFFRKLREQFQNVQQEYQPGMTLAQRAEAARKRRRLTPQLDVRDRVSLDEARRDRQ